MIAGCCEFMKAMLVAESGAERSVMDEESDLEQIKSCQKLLVSSNLFLTLTFWYIYGETLLHLKSFPGSELQTVFSKMAAGQCGDSFSSKSKIDQLKCWCHTINKMRPVIPWVTCQKWKIQCQQKMSSLYLVSGVYFLLCMKSAEVCLWLIVKGGSVLHAIATTEFTSRARCRKLIHDN